MHGQHAFAKFFQRIPSNSYSWKFRPAKYKHHQVYTTTTMLLQNPTPQAMFYHYDSQHHYIIFLWFRGLIICVKLGYLIEGVFLWLSRCTATSEYPWLPNKHKCHSPLGTSWRCSAGWGGIFQCTYIDLLCIYGVSLHQCMCTHHDTSEHLC